MLSADQIAEFDRNGCLIGGRVLDDARVDELRDELDRVIRQGKQGFPAGGPAPVMLSNMARGKGREVWQIVNIWEASPAFERLLYHPFVVKAISQLTRQPELQVWHDQIQYKPPRHGGVNMWHQDAPYWPIIRPDTPVSAWVALDDVDTDNGCMWMVPGSHKWGNHIGYLQKTKEEDFHKLGDDFTPPRDAEINEVKRIPWPVRKGEVSFHHSMTWHGSGANTSDRPRRAIAIHFMTGEATYVAGGQHPMKKFVEVNDGERMINAGPHFPLVCREGEPVVPEKLRNTSPSPAR